MKKVGKQVLFLNTSVGNLRNGEGTMLRLTDGRIMFAYTKYFGADWQDHCSADIAACYSEDEGESWTEPEIIIRKPLDAENIMSPSLMRLPDGGVGIIYLRKDMQDDMGYTCMPVFSRSDDEGRTWENATPCGLPLGYYCAINDGALVTKDGKIMLAVSYHGPRYDVWKKMKNPPKNCPAEIHFTVSEDSGKTWHEQLKVLKSPYEMDEVGLSEPGIYEHDNGDLWVYMRTGLGHQYQSIYTKKENSWTPVEVNVRFTTPDAPMRVKRVGDYVVAVYNPIAYNCLREEREIWENPKRTPIVVSLSKDDGRSFNYRNARITGPCTGEMVNNTYLLEDDMKESYCYPSILEVRDGFLVSYYHSNGTGICLNSSKMVKVYYSELN